jgi:hypothetical protein
LYEIYQMGVSEKANLTEKSPQNGVGRVSQAEKRLTKKKSKKEKHCHHETSTTNETSDTRERKLKHESTVCEGAPGRIQRGMALGLLGGIFLLEPQKLEPCWSEGNLAQRSSNQIHGPRVEARRRPAAGSAPKTLDA